MTGTLPADEILYMMALMLPAEIRCKVWMVALMLPMEFVESCEFGAHAADRELRMMEL
jgi:hypothetical protein